MRALRSRVISGATRLPMPGHGSFLALLWSPAYQTCHQPRFRPPLAPSAALFPPRLSLLRQLPSCVLVERINTWSAAMALAGCNISRHFCCEKNATARKIGSHHLALLRSTGLSLPPTEYLPDDILTVTAEHLAAIPLDAVNIIVSVSWPCLHRTIAGLRLGKASPLARLFDKAVELIMLLNARRFAHGRPSVCV
jgi:hypothetical protein